MKIILLFAEIEGGLIDMTRVVKTGMQLTVMSNITYPSLMVTGQGSLITKDVLTSIKVTVSEVMYDLVSKIIFIYN